MVNLFRNANKVKDISHLVSAAYRSLKQFPPNLKKIFAILILLNLLIYSVAALAVKPLVFDEAGLLTDEQVLELDNEANTLSDKYAMDIVITTTNDADGKSSREYADDYFDYGGFGQGVDFDGILFLLDMDNREAYISTSGSGIRYLTDERIERVLDRVFDSGLSDGDYFGAISAFIDATQSYLELGIPSNQYNQSEESKENKLSIFDILLALVGGTTTGGIFYGITKSRYKLRNPGNPFSYKNNSIVNIANTKDELVDTFVTHRVIPKPSNTKSSSSGRSSTHTSSSGRSHGGGGRRF